MEREDLLKDMNRAAEPPSADRNGAWVKVDRSSVGFDTTSIRPGEPVVGPDGATYYLGAGAPGFAEIEQGRHNAVPTPDNIVQMTPIVQPIALVPYASQNQPMLQYDPYQRPEAPKTERQIYKRKPYPALTLILAILALAGLVMTLVSVIVAPEGSGVAGVTGFAAISAILSFFGVKGVGTSYADGIVKALDGNALGVIFPVLLLVAAILFLVLFFVYLIRLVRGKTPRHFSILALINLLVSVGSIVVLYFINARLAPEAGFEDFIGGKSQVGVGVGLYASAALSLIMLIVPFCTNRHAYVRDYSAEDETFIIKE